MYQLYGDGIHDDYPAIQEMVDSGVCEVRLPEPEKFYLISKTITLPSNFKLTLPRYAEIRLADNANCVMLSNKLTPAFQERLPEDLTPLCKQLWFHVNEYSPDIAHTSKNIEISGGIWNFNNLNQLPNPEQALTYEPYGYTGDGMFFYNVKNIKLSQMTFKDPVHYGATFDRVSYFTVEDITFDYNHGNPCAVNMDGVHFNGNCNFGYIRNLKGTCYDDLVALNAHEGSAGPITNIEIDGLFAEDCHSAVRLLNVHEDIEDIHISNVYGTYYQYCIGLSKYYPGETTGHYNGIYLDNICASKAERLPFHCKGDSYVFPLIWIQEDTIVRKLAINKFHRSERINPVETIYVGSTTQIDNLTLNDINTENSTGEPMPLIVNKGHIQNFFARNIFADGDEEIVCEGKIEEVL